MSTENGTETRRFRNFDLWLAEQTKPEGLEPIEFQLAGHTFHCLNPAPAAVMGAMAAMAGTHQYVNKTLDWIASTLETEEEVTLFWQVVNGRDPVIPNAAITEITNWLMEEFAGRPSRPSSS